MNKLMDYKEVDEHLLIKNVEISHLNKIKTKIEKI